MLHVAQASGCNGDNCLNNFRNNAVSASSFCQTFTTATVTATTGYPTFMHSECTAAPLRLSIACTCLAGGVSTTTSTTTTTSCRATPTCTQAVSNGGFEGDSMPWVLTSDGGTTSAFFDTGNPLAGRGDLSIAAAHNVGLYVTVSQPVTLCQGQDYRLVYYLQSNAAGGGNCQTAASLSYMAGGTSQTTTIVDFTSLTRSAYTGFSGTIRVPSGTAYTLSISFGCPPINPQSGSSSGLLDQVAMYLI
jgi:hypothetical protein